MESDYTEVHVESVGHFDFYCLLQNKSEILQGFFHFFTFADTNIY